MSTLNTSDWNKLGSLMNGYIYSIALSTACELDLFTWLSQNPGATQERIAETLSLSHHAARVLLLACCAAKLIERNSDNLGYYNSQLAERTLVQHSELCMLPFIAFNRQVQLQGCLHLTRALQGNYNAGLDEFPGDGNTLYARLRSYPKLEQLFQEAMGTYTRISPQMIEMQEFDRVTHLLDVGGGDGTNAIRLCQQYPLLKVTILELPSVADIGKFNIERMGLGDRIKYVKADMFTDPWTKDCDGILMSHLVEILTPEKVVSLYRKAYEILPEGGRLFVWTLMTDDYETGGLQAAKAAIYLFTVASGEGMPWTSMEQTQFLNKAGFQDITHYAVRDLDHGAIIAKK